MKNATVTIDYTSFQSIKEKADKYDIAKLTREVANAKEREFVDKICNCIEKANDCKAAEQKQYYIALGIRAICEHYDMDLKIEYGELDEGKSPVQTDKEAAHGKS
ncbi:hypothetical protein [Paenibacillus pinihumi]|uniref:hypothetical protein n=1 Tax=Paenibacillus pinihumi TaxID=669462 RepID=UPI00041AAC25|nr:hypothetical protein [Paenibacillus pinihumi]